MAVPRGGTEKICCEFGTRKNVFKNQRALFSRIGSARLGRKVAFHGGYDIAPQHVEQKPARKR